MWSDFVHHYMISSSKQCLTHDRCSIHIYRRNEPREQTPRSWLPLSPHDSHGSLCAQPDPGFLRKEGAVGGGSGSQNVRGFLDCKDHQVR